ncbi:MAG: hypothetical protein ACTSYO_08185 [Candidatus Ranarchaeia archaeon]
MIPDIRIEIPVPQTLVIRQAQFIAFREFRLLRDQFPNEPQQMRRYGYDHRSAGVRGDYSLLTDSPSQIFELVFPTERWNDLIYRKSQFLANPDNSVAIYFIGSKNFNNITGHPSGTEIFLIDDNLYRKITWRSLGLKNEPAAVRYEEDGQLISFLHKCNKINKDPLKSLIVNGIGSEIMNREGTAARAKQESSNVRI